MSQQEAQTIIDRLERGEDGKHFREIAALNRRINDLKLRYLEKGLHNKETLALWKKLYPDYVPIRGQTEIFAKEIGLPKQFIDDIMDTVFSDKKTDPQSLEAKPDDKKREGRKTKAENVLAQNYAMTMQAIVAAEKNIALQELYRMIEKNPFEEFAELHDSKKSLGVSDDNIISDSRRIITVYFDGEAKYIKFNNDKGARIAANIKNMTDEQRNGIVKAIAKVNRMMASLMTTYSPEFMVNNFCRDYFFGTAVSFARYGAAVTAGVAKDAMKFVPGIWNAEVFGAKNNAAYWIQRYTDAGAHISFTKEHSFRNYTKIMEGRIKNAAGDKNALEATVGFIGAVGDGIEKFNHGLEIGIRVALFKNLIEKKDYSDKQAALASKNLSTNYNRKGTAKWINNIYIFSNSLIQSGHTAGAMFFDPDPGVRKRAWLGVGAGIFATGAMISLIGHSLGADEEGNERTKQSNIQIYVHMLNMAVPLPFLDGDKYGTLPIAYQFNTIYNMGRGAMDLLLDKNYTAADYAVETINNMVFAVNFFGGGFDIRDMTSLKGIGGTVLKNLAPAMFKPSMDIERNKNFAGRQIRPEWSDMSNSRQHWESVNPIFREFAYFANDMTGGDAYEDGVISLNPNEMEHYVRGYTAGLGATIFKVFSLGQSAITGEKVKASQIPFYSRFVKEFLPSKDNREAKEIEKKAKARWKKYKDLEDAGEREKAEKLKDDVNSYKRITLYEAIKKANSDIAKERNRGKRMEKDGDEGFEAFQKSRLEMENRLKSKIVAASDRMKKAKTKAEADKVAEWLEYAREKITEDFRGEK
jgi:hypothetical protein